MIKAWLPLCALVAFGPRTATRMDRIEEVCSDPARRAGDARVRVAWTSVDNTDDDDVRVTYCVLRGDRDARLSFERDAEIVYFAVSANRRRAEPRLFTFTVRTSTGRTLRQGPALLEAERELQSCRVDVCQFFTEPGERVVSVAVDSPARRR